MGYQLIDALGKDVKSAETRGVIQRYGLTDVRASPPFRHYYGSPQRGLDLLTEHDRVIDIQIFVQAAQGYSAFSDTLPLGLQREMNQQQVHQLLGPPTESDQFDSTYEMPDIGARLTVSYDDLSNIKYLSIALPKQLRKS